MHNLPRPADLLLGLESQGQAQAQSQFLPIYSGQGAQGQKDEGMGVQGYVNGSGNYTMQLQVNPQFGWGGNGTDMGTGHTQSIPAVPVASAAGPVSSIDITLPPITSGNATLGTGSVNVNSRVDGNGRRSVTGSGSASRSRGRGT